MEPKEMIDQAHRIMRASGSGFESLTEAQEFLRVYVGEKSAFYKQICEIGPEGSSSYIKNLVNETLSAFCAYIESGLLEGVSIERKAQIDVVSDFLEQANALLIDNKVHPAAPIMIIGASLEEFLRNWIEEAEIEPQGKPSIDSYAKALKGEELITKQDMKDITSWAGLRNHAAHGEWDEVSDGQRIGMMLEGVNLFMKKYGAG